MHCKNCGTEVSEKAVFCGFCGARQKADLRAQPASAAPVAAAAPGTPTHATQPAAPRKAWIWAGAVAVLLALAGGVAVWGWSNRGPDDSQRRVAATEDAKRQAPAANTAEQAEKAAAQAALDKHIAEEERQAKARTGAK
jgi:uncharacterized protein HemX